MMPGDRRGVGPRASSRLRRVALAVAVAAQIVTTAGLLVAAEPHAPTDHIGRRLGLDRRGPMMQPVNAPARIARVAVVPGSGGDEAWAIGYSRARKVGYDQVTPSGQVVFLRYTRARGWQVDGPPLDETGRPTNQLLSSLAVASTGEGWAVGAEGAMYHRAPGGRWVLQPRRATTNTLLSVSLGEDERGVFGYAVGHSLTFLRLDGGTWNVEQASGSVPTPGGTIPELGGVAAVTRDRAWAVSGQNSNALLVFRRDGGGWTRALTGRAMFDQPPAPVQGASGSTVNQFARGGAIDATGAGAWVSGMMQPIDGARVAGDTSVADRTRPFTLRFGDDGTLRSSYCPPIYQLSSAGAESTVAVCDRPFPFATGDLPTVSIAEDGAVFTAGYGVFRFDGAAWVREPNVVGYVVSASFASRTEGWVASAGDVFGGVGIASSSTITVGHWTDQPVTPSIRRWPHASRETLEAIALEPEDDGAVAVGARGTIVSLSADAGWEPMSSPTTEALHGVAWERAGRAWAVGAAGTILRFDGGSWQARAAGLTDRTLYAIALDGDHGFAVGDAGTILRYTDGTWRIDPASGILTTRRLAAVARAGDAFIAVGDAGTILVHRNRQWTDATGTAGDLASGQEGDSPNLLSVAGLPDGTAVIGGARSVMIERTPTGGFRPSTLPDLEGAIHTLALARTDEGRFHVVASVGTQGSRYAGRFLAQGHGWLFAGDADGWRDLGAARAGGSTPEIDAPALRDAAYAIALEPDGTRGWAVGGFPDNVFDDDGHLRSSSTASIWRIGLDGPPEAAPGETTARLQHDEGVRFAFLGDTACASGLCAASLGSGGRGDVVASAALAAIARAREEAGVRFLAFGGDLRRNGFPDELVPMRELLLDAGVPVFGVVGDKDRFAGIGPATGDQQGGLLSSQGYFLQVFRSMPQPWGRGPRIPGFEPVVVAGQPDGPDTALSHYAFDYAPADEPLLRVAFIDTSRVPLAESVQNPPEEQTPWLQAVLAGASARGIPSIVVMHQPVVLPVSTAPDAGTLTSILTAGGATAALASHMRVNEVVLAPNAAAPDPVVVSIFGSGGSPLQRDWRPESGAYHAWQLVTVDPDPARRSLAGRAPVVIRSIPVLESLALDARDGRASPSGGALRFGALGRVPDVGGAHGLGRSADQAQGRATYLSLPFPRACALLEDPARDGCRPASVVEPDFRFVSDDPAVAEFVRADPADPTRPFRDASGRLVHDERSGLLCTFGTGTTTVRVESGFIAAAVPVEVSAGAGPCTPRTFAPPDPAVVLPGREPRTFPPPDEPADPPLPKGRLPEPAGVAAIAPPLVNAAPAPPASGGGQRQEEHEVASERAEMTSQGVRVRAPSTTVGGIGVGAVLSSLAFVAALAARPRRRPMPAPSIAPTRNGGRR